MWCQCLQRRCRSTDAVEKRYGTNSLRNWFNSAKKNEMCLHNLGGVRIGRTRVWSTQLLARLQNVRKGKLVRWSTNERPKIAPVSWANHHESAKEWYVNKKNDCCQQCTFGGPGGPRAKCVKSSSLWSLICAVWVKSPTKKNAYTFPTVGFLQLFFPLVWGLFLRFFVTAKSTLNLAPYSCHSAEHSAKNLWRFQNAAELVEMDGQMGEIQGSRMAIFRFFIHLSFGFSTSFFSWQDILDFLRGLDPTGNCLGLKWIKVIKFR